MHEPDLGQDCVQLVVAIFCYKRWAHYFFEFQYESHSCGQTTYETCFRSRPQPPYDLSRRRSKNSVEKTEEFLISTYSALFVNDIYYNQYPSAGAKKHPTENQRRIGQTT